jgi:membrane protease subunit HflC
MDLIRRHPVASLLIGFFLLMMVFSSVMIVPETKQGIITRFGKPVRIINRYKDGAQIGQVGAGLAIRIPFVDRIDWIDKRVRDIEMDKQQVLSTDQLRLEVDAFARYRVIDPLRMYIRARSTDQFERSLAPILGSQLRNELGKRPFASLLSPEREGVMDNIRRGLNRVARQYGAEIIDVRIKKADLPDGTPLQSAFDRMRTARLQEARSIEAEGQKRALIIQAEADAEAAKTYAAAFGKDPEFYNFYRAMQSYKTTFLPDAQGKSGQTSIILSPNDEYLKEFTGR